MQTPLYIVGAGGIGCAVGHALATARPVLVDANLDKVRWGQEHGIVLDGHPPAPAARDVEQRVAFLDHAGVDACATLMRPCSTVIRTVPSRSVR